MRLQLSKDGFTFKAGQYVFLSIPAISWTQWHPFTVSSPPKNNDDSIVIYIKAVGGFTNQMLDILFPNSTRDDIIDNDKPKDLTIYVDGPYGYIDIKPLEHEVVMLISGGVGVTPMLSTVQNIFFKMLDEHSKIRTKKVYFIYCVKTMSMFQLFEGIFTEIKNSNIADRFSLYMHLTGENTDNPNFINGRANFNEYFTKIKKAHDNVKRIACYVCGPNEMEDRVWDMCYFHSDSSLRFEFHKETFEF